MYKSVERKRPVCISAANRIINRVNANNEYRLEKGLPQIKLTGMLLQKILYLCELAWLADHDDCKMIPEDFVAWSKGPVVPELYNFFQVYADGGLLPQRAKSDYKLTEEERDLINMVVDNSCDIPLDTLIDYARVEGSPWSDYRTKKNEEKIIITKQSMKNWIRDLNNQESLIKLLKDKTFTPPVIKEEPKKTLIKQLKTLLNI